MPLDPSISLQAKPVAIQPMDPMQTLLGVAQLKNLQSQEQFRNLQLAQLGMTMQQYQALQAPGGPLAQLSALGPPQAPGMVSGAQLGTLPPGGGLAAPSAPAPIAVPTPGPTETPASVNAPPPGAPMAGTPVPAPQAPPQAPQGAGRELPADMGSGTQSAKQAAILKDMLLKYPLVAPQVVKPFIEIDQQLLQQRKGELEFQVSAMGLVDQAMASVLDQPVAQQPAAYAQVRQMLIERGVPGAAQQLPPQYDPQAVQTLATSARDKKTRVEQDLAKLGRENDAWKNAIEQAKLGEVEWRQDASGFWFATPKTPGAKTGALGGSGTGGVGAPAVNPATGQPYRSMEALKYQSEQERALGTEFQKVTEPFTTVRNAYNQVQTAQNTDPTNPVASDLALLYGYIQMINPTGGVRPGAALTPEQLRSIPEQFQKMYEQLTKPGGQALVKDQREAILAQAAKDYRAMEQTYEQQLATARAQAKAYPNVRPEIVAPDIRAHARPYTQADVDAAVHTLQRAGRKETAADVEKYFQSQGRRKGD